MFGQYDGSSSWDPSSHSKALIGSELPDPSASSPPGTLPGGRVGGWLLALQRPHVGGLGTLRPRRHVELDRLPLIK